MVTWRRKNAAVGEFEFVTGGAYANCLGRVAGLEGGIFSPLVESENIHVLDFSR